MRSSLSFLSLGTAMVFCLGTNAQNWVNGGNALAANGSVGTNTNFALIFETNNLERGRITNAGNWGIGTTSPIGKFHVNGIASFGSSITAANATRVLNLVDVNAVMRIVRVHASNAPAVELISRTSADGANVAYWDMYTQPSDKSFRIRERATGANLDRMIITQSGLVGIGTLTPSSPLHVIGRGRFSNGLTVEQAGTYSVNTNGNGVEAIGNTSYGMGVYGSGYYGVYGNSSSYGVYATSGFTGVYSTGTTYGVRGVSNGGWGVWGQSSSSLGVYGSSGSNYGLYGFSSTYPAVYGSSNGHYGVEAHSANTWGTASYGVAGVYGQGTTSYGVYGTSTDGWGGYFYSANSYGIWVKTGRADKNWAGVFDGNVYAYGAYQTSDKNLKKNIEDFSDALSIINQLKPRSYEFRQDGKLSSMHLPQGKHYGFIAQDMERILPNLVQELDGMISDEKNDEPKPTPGIASDAKEPAVNAPVKSVLKAEEEKKLPTENMKIKSINYIELIPLLVKGMQEQDSKLQNQEEEIKKLRQEIAELRQSISGVKGSTNNLFSGTVSLEQNSPNPSRGTTAIRYYLPGETSVARLTLTNAKGQQLKSIQLTGRGNGQISLSTIGLPSGIYQYSLWVDGKEVATKQLMVSN